MLARSTAAGRSARSLLGLPSHRRPHLSCNAAARRVAAPQVRSMSGWEEKASELPLDIPYYMFDALHACGLPWYLAIPTGAALVRGLILLPLLQIPARKAQQRSALLTPLRRAYHSAVTHQIHKKRFDRGPRQARIESRNALAQYSVRLGNRWNASRWRMLRPLAGLPIFMIMAETIRRMAGYKSGLWGIVFGEATRAAEAPTAAGRNAPDGPDDAFSAPQASKMQADWGDAFVPDTLASDPSLPAAVSPSPAVDAAAQSGSTAREFFFPDWIQPSLADGGALWFPDLMAADPTCALPFIVSGLTLATIYRGSKLDDKNRETPTGRNLRRILMTAALAIGPMTLHMPAAIMVYWVSSTSCAYVSHLFLDKFYPLKMPPKPCKRTVGAPDLVDSKKSPRG